MMLIGRVERTAASLVTTVDMVDVATGTVVASQRATGEAADDIFGVTEDLRRKVQRTLRPDVEYAPGHSLSSELTTSVDAYRAYVEAEDRIHRKDFAGAIDKFQEAARIDPGFALAYYRLSIAAAWSAVWTMWP